MAVRRRNAGNEILLLDALKDLCSEKDIEPDLLFDAIEAALVFAYKKSTGAEKNVEIDLNRDTGIFHIYEVRKIVAEVKNPHKEISLEDAQKIHPNYEVGDVIKKEVKPSNFGRIAAQAAKQFVMQKIREAERGVVYEEYTNLENDMISGTVTRIEEGNLIIDLDKTEAILPLGEQMRGERYKIGDRVRAYIAEVKKVGKGPQIYLSRTHPGLLKKLFEMNVPEIQEGIITVKSVAREAGMRSKIAVTSSDENIDAVGSCVGQHGVRVQAVVDEIGAEKIDIIQWEENPALFIAAALSPAKVFKVGINEFEKISRVVVPDMQLSLAIGREGQNARLAARLTGWKIDIKSKSQAQDDPAPENMKFYKVKSAGGKAVIAPKKKKKKKKKKKSVDQQNVENIQVENNPVEVSAENVQAENNPAEVSTENVQAENNPVEVSAENVQVENNPVEVSAENIQTENNPVEVSAENIQTENNSVEVSAENIQAENNPAEVSAENAQVENNPVEVSAENAQAENNHE